LKSKYYIILIILSSLNSYARNYELCKENQNDSGMAEALTEKATTLELPVLQTPKSDILAEYKRAAVLATRSRNYSLLVTIYGNISSLYLFIIYFFCRIF